MTATPNILFLMADQLTASALRLYGNTVCKTPNLDRLAARATLFENMYCNFPLCAPSRVAMLTGQLPSKVGVYDNATEFAASVPTFAHHLKLRGYSTTLSGKMHFVGPDQQHGFDERLTTDIYPSDFGWTPDWRQAIPVAPTGMNMRSVVEAGVCQRSMQIDFDDDVTHKAVQKIYDLGRMQRERPFFLCASLTHPHNPYVTTQDFLDLYEAAEIDMPVVGDLPLDQMDAHSQRLWYMFRRDEHRVSADQIRNARHAYYGMVSYVDAQVGRLLDSLDAMDLRDTTAIVFTADHGDMLGERGLWYKWTHYENAVRIPLLIALPGQTQPQRRAELVSLVDLFPTLTDLAGIALPAAQAERLAGHSLLPLLQGAGEGWDNVVYGEMNAEGTLSPRLMVREGRWKYHFSHLDRPQLYDLQDDPHELRNLAGTADVADVEARLRERVLAMWDPADLHARIQASQVDRLMLQQCLLTGDYRPWDYQPHDDASRKYVRSGAQSSPSVVKGKLRYPPVSPTPMDTPRVAPVHILPEITP